MLQYWDQCRGPPGDDLQLEIGKMNMWSGLLLFVGGVMKLSHGTSSFLQVFLMCYIKRQRPCGSRT